MCYGAHMTPDTTWTHRSKDGKTVITTSTSTTFGTPTVATSVVSSSVFSDPRMGDTWQRTYVWTGQEWKELDVLQKPVNWTEQSECPVYGSEENAYEAGFAEGKLAERMTILEEFAHLVASNDDAEVNDVVDLVWDRMTEAEKEEKWPV